MRKKLLEEGTIRQFMKLAQLEPLASDFLREGDEQKTEEGVHNTKEEKISLEEMMYDLEEEESGMEEEMDMEGPEEEVEDMDMGAEEEEAEDMEMGAEEEELTEQIMKRVQNRLRKLKNK